MTVVFRKELKRNLRGFIGWAIVVAAIVACMMALYPMVADNAAQIDELLSVYPKGMLAAVNLDQLKMSDVMGFYASETFTFAILISSIYAVLLAGGIIAKEESDKTIAYLLAKPIARTEIVTAKSLVVGLYVLVLNVVQFVTAYVAIEAVKRGGYSFRTVVLLSLGATFLNLLFAAMGLLVSVFIPKLKSLYPTAIGLVMGFYFLNLMIKLSSKLAWLKWLSPFYFTDPGDIVGSGALQWKYIAVAVVAAGLFIAGVYHFYQKKDITA